jgi:hypothetical protein
MTALTAPTQSTAETGGAVLAALGGAGLALLPKRPHPRALTAAGLVLLLAGLMAGYLAAGGGAALPGRRGGAAARAYLRDHGARRARRAGDGSRALDADRGGRHWSRRTGPGLHRVALVLACIGRRRTEG